MSRLEEQIEAFEADLETLGSGEGRRTAAELPPRMDELEAFIQRHRQHIIRMEQVLRLLANDQACDRDLTEGVGYWMNDVEYREYVTGYSEVLRGTANGFYCRAAGGRVRALQ